MCGIAGICGLGNGGEKNIRRMTERLIHRGPDAGDIWAGPGERVWLGHRRLAIRDLSEAGAQPMVSKSGWTDNV